MGSSFNPASTVNIEMHLGLRVVEGEFLGQEFSLASRLVVGRGDRADLHLKSQRVSRAHCLFVRTEHHVVVSDLRSRNGTWVNGKPINKSTRLALGDRVSVGSCILQLISTLNAERFSTFPDEDETTFLAEP